MFVSAADSLSLEAGRIAHILQPTFEYQAGPPIRHARRDPESSQYETPTKQAMQRIGLNTHSGN